jgi:fructose-1,6-bisphosphatase/inositol monophosphatase family enzyme
MNADPAVARKLALDFVKRSRALLWPYLVHPSRFEAELAGVVGRQGEGNEAYRVDQMVDDLLVELLEERGIVGRVFSEESGWRHMGSGDVYTVVCDPFDNSFLSTRSFRDSSVVISIGDSTGRFLACAVGDLATSAVYLADDTGAHVLEEDGDEWRRRTASTSSVRRLEDAFVVLPAMLRPERPRALGVPDLVARAKHLITLDGAIFMGRLAAGYVDAYVDVVVGQPVYEVASLEMITRAGGVVTDLSGEPLGFERVLAMVEHDPSGRTSVVAAASLKLHREILRALRA